MRLLGEYGEGFQKWLKANLLSLYEHLSISMAPQGSSANFVNIAGSSFGLKIGYSTTYFFIA
jgi:hypothetical protein